MVNEKDSCQGIQVPGSVVREPVEERLGEHLRMETAAKTCPIPGAEASSLAVGTGGRLSTPAIEGIPPGPFRVLDTRDMRA